MHLVPGGRRVIDGDHRICDAIAALSDQTVLEHWAEVFAVLGDSSRLALLISIRRAGRICVSDLAAATSLKEATVSQALRLLRSRGVVTADRDGRLVRYAIADDHVAELVDRIAEGGPSIGSEGPTLTHRSRVRAASSCQLPP
jgi:ArsR family transcriptional regulator, lead/cadmium/zinc/bismuth-responsive transcriptional repressor